MLNHSEVEPSIMERIKVKAKGTLEKLVVLAHVSRTPEISEVSRGFDVSPRNL